MDELTLQVKNMKDDLTAQVVRTEEGQCQMGAALRDIEASLLKKTQGAAGEYSSRDSI